jgi:hypothetical protein
LVGAELVVASPPLPLPLLAAEPLSEVVGDVAPVLGVLDVGG